MPNFSGIWSATQQFQARGQNIWPKPPGAPTIGTATAGNSLCASVTFTAPSCTGYPAGVSSYTVTSTPGCFTASGAASPLTVTGLTNATSYTFKVKATGTGGLIGPCSAASNSITASNAGSQSYTTAGTYSWVAPAGVTSVSVVAVGGGGGGGGASCGGGGGGGGGGLAYKNNISVTPGNTYSVVVGVAGTAGTSSVNGGTGGTSSFNSTCVSATGGTGGYRFNLQTNAPGGTATNGTGFTGGQGTRNINTCRQVGGGGGGAAGYSGNGGDGNTPGATSGFAGSGGGGGGGAVGYNYGQLAGAGGGVGILGEGANGTGGASANQNGTAGSGGSGQSYGGGGGGIGAGAGNGGAGGVGAVRIIWPGNTRSFPSTNAGNP